MQQIVFACIFTDKVVGFIGVLSPSSAYAMALIYAFNLRHSSLEVRVICALRPGRHFLLAMLQPLRPKLAQGLPLLARHQHFPCCPARGACFLPEPAHAVVACPCTGFDAVLLP